ncbi:MAG: Bacterial cell division membrane protein [Candidatus Daviesbacteria bacterium GW2011_GWA2_38_24]|uniref:Probable peptidoglycan glycosyltransferase FtsW n=1 Tax=Candidatus Daviesbacteria bacterium GW2011_GWA2_38_24 TaxID=1618422 RepID=A0A0G0MQH6_9BACT|nr:MAG: Bacterial cell division membrane protein [Candidatus Daviesbacteria bacterium GW2011_GWA2_38_24]KKQ78952.1 MAG: Bacterial cell division membrane protein [Candidatus Daviesbacteria bacterium GW2011_GWA1_38_7]OGE23944.1 MAG: cell division protein FtsW [Candidatus Daviesbacteria bacterium RIFCSPHIGHO2_01_FULL_38_8]
MRSNTSKKITDLPLLVTVLVLSLFGLVMVYDASVVQAFKDHGDKYFYIKQQLVWMTLGFLSLIFFSFFNYQHFKKLAVFGLGVTFILTLLVFVPGLGFAAGGAHRWLRIGGVSIQPAEMIKLATIIYLSYLFEKKMKVAPFLITTLAVTIVIGLFQRDLGSAIVYFLISLGMFFIAGAPMMYFLSLIPVTLIGLIIFILSSPYRKKRVLAFLDPFADPEGYSYHISQILIALGSGGLFGLGLGQSKQKFEYIPEVTTDSIFAIVGEELGFIGAIILISLLVFLIHRGFKIYANCKDRFGALIAFGLTFWLGIQTVVNLAAMVSLIPLTGVPLPFVSYGGSALLVNLTSIGILLNISKNS